MDGPRGYLSAVFSIPGGEKAEKNEADTFIPGCFSSGADGGLQHIGRATEQRIRNAERLGPGAG
jgi:hypothetical protein